VALVFAVGGSLALANVPSNSVRSGKIKDRSVQSRDLNNNSVNSRHVRANSLHGGDINEATLNGSLIPGVGAPPPPPAAGVQTLSQRLGPNQTASLSAGGFTVTETTDAAGSCNVEEITATEAGRYTEAELEDPEIFVDIDPIAAGATEALSALNAEAAAGPIYAMADDGTGGATFSFSIDDVGGRCNVVITGIAA
jgi:hypothetical protein